MKKPMERLVLVSMILVFIFTVTIMVLRYFYPQYTFFDSTHHMYGGMNFGMGVFSMGIFWVVIIGIVFYYLFHQNKTDNFSSIEKLKSRLANGEISLEEFDKIKNKIKE